jgi:hypothetical protein
MIDTSTLNTDWGWTNPAPSATTAATLPSTTAKVPVPTTEADAGTFNYPSEYDQAGDIWSQMAQGTYTNPGIDWLKSLLAGGGASGSFQDWQSAYAPTMMDNYSDMVKQMAEQAGVGGTRYSSGLQGQIAGYGGKLQNQYNLGAMNKWAELLGIDTGTAGGLAGLMGNLAGMGGQGLQSLGQQRVNDPLNVAQTYAGIENMSNMNELNWAQLLAGLMGNTGAEQQTYTPSWIQQLLGGLGGTLPTSLPDIFNPDTSLWQD